MVFCGDGKLKDGNETTAQFREFLKLVPSDMLGNYTQECLQDTFQDNGLALQDIVNQIGMRLGFSVHYGVYRGSQKTIGFDGLWKSDDNHAILVEVKTTDAYRIDLDTIMEYRNKLAAQGTLNADQTSILIVVGREDTGGLEAQVRGSKHAWEIRLISTDSLLKMLALKEKLDDAQTIYKINEILKPQEFTRIDKLVDLMFATAQDVEEDDVEEVDIEKGEKKRPEKKFSPVNFHQDCVVKIEKKLGISLLKQSRSAYDCEEHKTGLILAVSKAHAAGVHQKYWFAFHPYYKTFLDKYETSYVAFGCGSDKLTLLLKYRIFKTYLDHLWFTTKKDGSIYWHVVIHEDQNRLELQLPKKDEYLDLKENIVR